MKLWGGDSDTGCCSVADVDDARRVAQQLDIDHLVFNFGDDFDDARRRAVRGTPTPTGITPNPCIECNRHLKFARLAERADLLGFDAVATGHHARVGRTADGRFTSTAAPIAAKDQSYVVHMLGQEQLARTLFPVGDLTKAEVRARAARSACAPPTSPTARTCASSRRPAAAARRSSAIASRSTAATVVDTAGDRLGEVDAVELVTVGQRKGLGLPGGGPKRYVVDVDVAAGVVVVGDDTDLLRPGLDVHDVTWVDGAVGQVGARSTCSCSAAPTATRARRRRSGSRMVRGRWARSGSSGTSRSGGSRRARASCSTTWTTRGCSAAGSPADQPTGRRRAAAAASAWPGRLGLTRNAVRWMARPFGSFGVKANSAVTVPMVSISTA